ncbi:MAG: exodeoxyribonuclease VII large subunit [Nitrospinae bacterium]|nr:exodeoxyribonuclease VII large subunit [Nitrospinota bacterium]
MPEDPTPDGRIIYTVSQLAAELKGVVEGAFSGVWVEGEISQWKLYPSGHTYFTLKDERAIVECVLWKGQRRYVAFEPKTGDHVVVRGRLSIYQNRSQYQLVAEFIEPKGLGALQAAFEALKKKLLAEGLFDEARKKPIPAFPQVIGLVTSEKGAAVHDMIRTIRRRFPGRRIVLNPVPVQGEGAADKIARAIGDLNEWGRADVIIAGRGGGSMEDLWAFNEEVVARAIAASRIPVISAVGHEVDFTIADFVADLRASTPTAAAEIVTTPTREEVEQTVAARLASMTSVMRGLVEGHRRTADELAMRGERSARRAVADHARRLEGARRHLAAVSPIAKVRQWHTRLDGARKGLAIALRTRSRSARASVESALGRFMALRPRAWVDTRRREAARLESALDAAMGEMVSALGKRLAVAEGRLTAYSPMKVLERGYSIVMSADGKKVIRSVGQVASGDVVRIKFSDGEKQAVIDGERKGRQGKLF